jgi:hypothetical protein
MRLILLCAIGVVRALLCGFVFAWMTVSMPLTEFYVLANSPYAQLMAHDVEFGYETARTLSYLLPILGVINFCVGTVVGALWRFK